MKPELDNQSVHRYMRVYNYYKQLILSQQLANVRQHAAACR